jgi:hypothetical protein
MNDITLESLARRVEALEQALAVKTPSPTRKDWQRVVGMFAGCDFMNQVDEEGRKIREAERTLAQGELRNPGLRSAVRL